MPIFGRTVKAAFFDLDDTLVMTSEHMERAYGAVADYAQALHQKLDQDDFIVDFKKLLKESPWDVSHKVPVAKWRARMWHKCLKNQGYDDAPLATELQDTFDTTRLQHFPWIDGVPAMIESLKSQGIKCAIITNGEATVQRDKIVACRALDLFDWVLVGGEEVVEGRPEKPHASIFLKACKLVGCKPCESIMVGDSMGPDIQGGANAGFLATVWVSHGKPLPPPKPGATARPTFVIERPADLEGALRGARWGAPTWWYRRACRAVAAGAWYLAWVGAAGGAGYAAGQPGAGEKARAAAGAVAAAVAAGQARAAAGAVAAAAAAGQVRAAAVEAAASLPRLG